MLVLGLESSCDETAAAVVEDGHRVLSDVIASQVDVHARYGGVVPELASRAHITNVVTVMESALADAGITLDDIDGIAVTQGPGLIGALMVALQTAKAISYARNIPVVGVHHLEGHLSAIRLEDEYPPFPHLALVVSGGHTSLMRVDGPGQLVELGATRDDAAGEAFDKVAKLLGLGYPGGVHVDRLAQTGDASVVALPRPMTKKETGLEFSFSGLKTAVLNIVRSGGVPEGQALADLCASFQATVVEVLVRKTRMAAKQEGLAHVQVCGGVAANSGIRKGLAEAAALDGFRLYVPRPIRCTDNAAMIAAAGTYRLQRGDRDGFDLSADSGLPLPSKAAAIESPGVSAAFPDARTLLKRYGFSAKKSWGQNFLISDRVYRGIVDATVRNQEDWVVEIGSGLGTLTMRLAERVPNGKVIAIEREPDMLSVLKAELEHLDNVEIHAANAMTYDYASVAKWSGSKIAVCGNLPYQIASQILFRLLDMRDSIHQVVAMIQKEMADRIVAPPGIKAYGAISVLLGAYADISTVVQAAPGDFSPAPKVHSTVIKLKMRSEPVAPIADPAAFSQVVHAAFSQRRKTLRNALQSQYEKSTVEAALDHAGIDGIRRGETLDVAEFAALTDSIALAVLDAQQEAPHA